MATPGFETSNQMAKVSISGWKLTNGSKDSEENILDNKTTC